jgi:hypothetical protein
LKLDLHGIRFRFWLVFFALAIGITVFIGALQTGLIRPYYRNSKIASVRTVADHLEDSLVEGRGTQDSVREALREAVNNSVCVVMYNENGTQVYDADSLGAGCVFSGARSQEIRTLLSKEGMQEILSQDNAEYSVNMTNPSTGQETIVYGRKIRQPLATYYMFVNSPLEPVDSVVTFFTRQYAYYTLIAILIASLVAFMCQEPLPVRSCA